jgi:hypothetical protein
LSPTLYPLALCLEVNHPRDQVLTGHLLVVGS